MKKLLLSIVLTFSLPIAWAAGEPAAPGQATLKGEVLEVVDVEAYTYLRLKTSAGEKWAAVNKAPVKKGAQVTIFDPTEMQNFESRSLKRTFPQIYFGTIGIAAAGTDLNQVHGGISNAPSGEVIKVAKAEGANARSVAEINANRLTLKDKPVTVRAKVVKVNANVMGTNWVHLRDGSGKADDGSNDILVTSKGEPKVGDVVVAKGVVKTDVNLGSGYAYKVLVENASFEK